MRLRSVLWMLFGLVALPLQATASAKVAMSQPSVSPDGGQIAFVANGGIWTVASGGGKAHLLVADDGGADSRPLYSPDGRQLAFQSDTGGEGSGIYLLDLSSGNLRRLTWADGSNQLDAWSRDSQWIYLSSSRDNVGGMAGVYRVRASGGTPMPVSMESYRNESMAAPAPDGTSLALVGGGEAAVTHFTDGRVLWPSLAANGMVLAFERDFGIWTLDPANGHATPLAIELSGAIRGPQAKYENLSHGFSQIALSPDGKKLAVIAHGEVFATDAAKGGHARRLTRTAAAEYDLAWAP